MICLFISLLKRAGMLYRTVEAEGSDSLICRTHISLTFFLVLELYSLLCLRYILLSSTVSCLTIQHVNLCAVASVFGVMLLYPEAMKAVWVFFFKVSALIFSTLHIYI